MYRSLLLFSLLLLWLQNNVAQDVVGCNQLLEDAKEAYAGGMVELVPDLLKPCLESGDLTGEPRMEAYKLVINAFLFDYLPEEADTMMSDFVEEFPDYRAKSSDPAEFTLLLETHLRAKGIDPNKVAVTEEQGGGGQQAGGGTPGRERTKSPFSYENSMGFRVGGNGTFPQMIERYSIGNPATDEGRFSMAPGLEIGATMNLILSEAVEASFGLSYNRSRFSYSATPLSFASYVFLENEHRLQIPANMVFRLNPQSRTSVYLCAGFVADYLLAATGEGTRSYTESLKDVVVEKTSIADARTRINIHGLAGAGIRFPLENAFVFLEARFTTGIFKVNQGENRYSNQDLTWLLYHVDSDFRIHQVSVSAGMAWNL